MVGGEDRCMTLKTSDGPVIPKNYEELRHLYGATIISVINKNNKVKAEFSDLHQYIWMRLIEANVLERFETYAQLQTPKVLTALEACDLLGISWGQWVTAMWAFHKGDPISYDAEGNITARRRGRWMPTPINLAEYQARGTKGYSSKSALFDFEEIVELTLDEHRFKSGRPRKAFRLMGREIQDGVVVSEKRVGGCVKMPETHVTKFQFRNYLVMAVGNHYANYCRKEHRRHKERPYSPPSAMEGSESWEATLPDKNTRNADAVVALSEFKMALSSTLATHMDGVTSCKPLAEHETELFQLIGDGASLFQALKRMSLPTRVKLAILDTIRPMAVEFDL